MPGRTVWVVGVEEQPAGVELEERRLPVGAVHGVADDVVRERVGRVLAEPVMPNVPRAGVLERHAPQEEDQALVAVEDVGSVRTCRCR